MDDNKKNGQKEEHPPQYSSRFTSFLAKFFCEIDFQW